MIPDHVQRDYQDQRILIMGLGSLGGGLGAVQFLASRGARLTITDERNAETLSESLQEISTLADVQLKLGGHDVEDFRQTDLVVVNPAIQRDHPCLEVARSAGIPLTSEMNLFWQWNLAPIVAVTGSNGKSTTTALTHSILSQTNRRCWLGGNIGISLLPFVDRIGKSDLVVLELSSFQLADLARLQVSPEVALMTNFSPNHLDWHGNLRHYRDSKQTIFRWQTATQVAILNSDDPNVLTSSVNGEQLEFGIHDRGHTGVFGDNGNARLRIDKQNELLPLSDWLKLPGRHNFSNALAAICAAIRLGVTLEDLRGGIENYNPLPHRLQFVAEIQGRKFYNDSLATTPESTGVALEAFSAPIVLMAGGYDKKVDLSHLATVIAHRAKAVALIGQTSGYLRELMIDIPDNHCHVSSDFTSFRDACRWAVAASERGDVILLSPGCASYGWFRNFVDRGQQFIDFVQSLALDTPENPHGLASRNSEA